MSLPPNPSDTASEIYQKCVAASFSKDAMLRGLKDRALDSQHFSEPGIYRLSFMFVTMKCKRTPIVKWINWPVVEKELAIANGARRQRGILDLGFVRDNGPRAVGLTSTGNYVLVAPHCWRRRILSAVTAMVVTVLPDGGTLGYAVALPCGHPLLSGAAFHPLSDRELQAFFPVAYDRKIRGYESGRMANFVSEPVSGQDLTTNLDLI